MYMSNIDSVALLSTVPNVATTQFFRKVGEATAW